MQALLPPAHKLSTSVDTLLQTLDQVGVAGDASVDLQEAFSGLQTIVDEGKQLAPGAPRLNFNGGVPALAVLLPAWHTAGAFRV